MAWMDSSAGLRIARSDQREFDESKGRNIMRYIPCLAATTAFLAYGLQPARATDPVTLDNYSCEMFLADIANPETGERLLRSMMMMAWATGYTSAYTKEEPRTDTETMGALAMIIGTACRKVPKHKVTEVVIGMVGELASAQPPAAPTAKPMAKVATVAGLAPGASHWNQDGSIIKLVAEGASRKFHFETPRDALKSLGVAPGATLFEGKKEGARYLGTAYAFAAKCKPQPFAVTGDIAADEKQITLRGKQPALDAKCRVTGYSDEALVLTFIPPEEK